MTELDIQYVCENELNREFRKEDLTIMCFNAWSLVNKMTELELYLRHLEQIGIIPDIICVSETFLNEELLKTMYDLTNYNAYHYFRPTKRRGGGVSVYARENLKTGHNIRLINHNEIQYLILPIRDFNFEICITYRPPTHSGSEIEKGGHFLKP